MRFPIHVLLIEDDAEHAELIKSHIARKHDAAVKVHWFDRLSTGLSRLEDGGIDIILLDMSLPDSPLDQTLNTVLSVAPGMPIVVLSSLDDEEFGMKAVHQGAQDYISKNRMDGGLLFRSLRYAIERKATEEELRESSRTKDEFLATVSHELRTPVGVISGFAEVLRKGHSNSFEQKEMVEIIARNAQLLVTLIDDLLDMSRATTGKLSIFAEPLSLIPLIQEAIDSLKFIAEKKRIQIVQNLDTSVGLVNCDPIRVHQILWNILSNSIKFTPENGKVGISLAKKGDKAEIVVRDNGEGIAAEFLPFVFDRFRQQDNTIRRQHGGMGLGLSIVKYLTEMHKGTISVKSDGVGKGTEIAVLFPIFEGSTLTDGTETSGTSAKDDAEKKSLLKLIKNASAGKLSGKKILAIDDSPDLLRLVGHVLKKAGADVQTASSAEEGRAIIGRTPVDLIVCDIGMPGEDGYSFLRSIRKLEVDAKKIPTPAIALTAYTRDKEKQAAYDAGFQLHLAKPLKDAELINAIDELLQNKAG